MIYVKRILEDIVDYAYSGSDKLERYKKFYVEVTDKDLRSKHGDYDWSSRRIRLFNMGRDQDSLIMTAIHELAHHIDHMNRAHDENFKAHDKYFYKEYATLAKAAVDMHVFSLEDFLNAKRDTSGGNKIRAMLQGYQPKETDYKEGLLRITVNNGFSVKEELKAHGYRWNSSSRVWQKEVSESDILQETDFLNSIEAEYSTEDARRMKIGREKKEKIGSGSPGGNVTVFVHNDYEIREQLKSSGYRWNQNWRGWTKKVDEMEEELEAVFLNALNADYEMVRPKGV